METRREVAVSLVAAVFAGFTKKHRSIGPHLATSTLIPEANTTRAAERNTSTAYKSA